MFAINSLIYLNQSVPPYGVSLNSLTDVSTEFLLSKCTPFDSWMIEGRKAELHSWVSEGLTPKVQCGYIVTVNTGNYCITKHRQVSL